MTEEYVVIKKKPKRRRRRTTMARRTKDVSEEVRVDSIKKISWMIALFILIAILLYIGWRILAARGLI